MARDQGPRQKFTTMHVYLCMWAHAHTYMHTAASKVHTRMCKSETGVCSSLSIVLLSLYGLIPGLTLARNSPNRLVVLESWGSTCFCLTNTGILSICHYTQILFKWVPRTECMFSCMQGCGILSYLPRPRNSHSSATCRMKTLPSTYKTGPVEGMPKQMYFIRSQCHNKFPKHVKLHGLSSERRCQWAHVLCILLAGRISGFIHCPPWITPRWIHTPGGAISSELLGCISYIIRQQPECWFLACPVLPG